MANNYNDQMQDSPQQTEQFADPINTLGLQSSARQPNFGDADEGLASFFNGEQEQVNVRPNELRVSTEDTWREIEKGLENAWENIKSAFGHAMSRYKDKL